MEDPHEDPHIAVEVIARVAILQSQCDTFRHYLREFLRHVTRVGDHPTAMALLPADLVDEIDEAVN